MIYFLTFKEHKYTIELFIEFSKSNNCIVSSYEEINTGIINSNDTLVFCDIDRCNDNKLKELIDLHKKVSSRGCSIVNDPNKVLRRFDLLDKLHLKGINDFQLHRTSNIGNITFPVFLRDEFEHNGALTELFHECNNLKKAINSLDERNNIIVSEFVDTSKSEIGHYHKFGAFFINNTVIPRHFFISDNWCVKGAISNRKLVEDLEREYLINNPHSEKIKSIFKLANIDFGRIDYAFTNKGIQVFEINTNPTIIDQWDIDKTSSRYYVTESFVNKLVSIIHKMA